MYPGGASGGFVHVLLSRLPILRFTICPRTGTLKDASDPRGELNADVGARSDLAGVEAGGAGDDDDCGCDRGVLALMTGAGILSRDNVRGP